MALGPQPQWSETGSIIISSNKIYAILRFSLSPHTSIIGASSNHYKRIIDQCNSAVSLLVVVLFVNYLCICAPPTSLDVLTRIVLTKITNYFLQWESLECVETREKFSSGSISPTNHHHNIYNHHPLQLVAHQMISVLMFGFL